MSLLVDDTKCDMCTVWENTAKYILELIAGTHPNCNYIDGPEELFEQIEAQLKGLLSEDEVQVIISDLIAVT